MARDSSPDSVVSEAFRRWRVPADVANEVTVEFSPRLRSSLGICYPERKLIRLHPFLARQENVRLLREVVCHEAAHIAAPFRSGQRVKPHGPEWQALVRQCGYNPRVRLRVPEFLAQRQKPKRSSKGRARFEHRCPVCQTSRLASRPQPRWRCADCVDAGLGGKLAITSILGSTRKGARIA